MREPAGLCVVSVPLSKLSVLLIGWLLGGKVGVGTVVYAFAIGPLIQLFLPWFRQPRAVSTAAKSRGLAS